MIHHDSLLLALWVWLLPSGERIVWESGGVAHPWMTPKRSHVQIDCTMKRNLPLCSPVWWNFQATVCLTVLWERYDLFILKENPSLFRLTVMACDILLRPRVTLNYPVFKHENKLDPAGCIHHDKNDMATKNIQPNWDLQTFKFCWDTKCWRPVAVTNL